jgi:hypothetical protein
LACLHQRIYLFDAKRIRRRHDGGVGHTGKRCENVFYALWIPVITRTPCGVT